MPDPLAAPADRPGLRVLRGNPDDAEVAALVVALAAVSAPATSAVGTPGASAPARVDGWAALWRGIGAPVPVGPGAWTAAVGIR